MLIQIIFLIYLITIVVNAIIVFTTHLWVNKNFEEVCEKPEEYEDNEGGALKNSLKELYTELNYNDKLKVQLVLSGPILWIIIIYILTKKSEENEC